MKKDSKITYDSVLEWVNSLAKAQDKTNNTLKADFMRALKSVGEIDAAKEVEKKGLPTHIIVSSDIYPVCMHVMTKYAKVFENKLIDTKCTVMFAWDGLKHPSLDMLSMPKLMYNHPARGKTETK